MVRLGYFFLQSDWGKPNIRTVKCNVSNYASPIYLIYIDLLDY